MNQEVHLRHCHPVELDVSDGRGRPCLRALGADAVNKNAWRTSVFVTGTRPPAVVVHARRKKIIDPGKCATRPSSGTDGTRTPMKDGTGPNHRGTKPRCPHPDRVCAARRDRRWWWQGDAAGQPASAQPADQGSSPGHAQRGPLRMLKAAGRAHVVRRPDRRIFAGVECLHKQKGARDWLERAPWSCIVS